MHHPKINPAVIAIKIQVRFGSFPNSILLIWNSRYEGGCINASPAGKRRIAVGVEQQQFGSSYGNTGGLYGNLLDDKFALGGGNGKSGDSFFSRVGSPFTTITAIAVAACLLIVTVFAVIFAILQVR